MKRGDKTSLLLALFVLSLNTGVFAQEDPLLMATDDVVSTDEIDIEGLYKKKSAPTAADRIQKLRRQLEVKHEQMMRRKIETMRLAEERKLAKKLERALNGQLQSMDSVSTYAAAPVQSQKLVAPLVVEKDTQRNSSIKISGGFMNITSEQNDLDANANISLAFEGQVSPRVSVGVSVRYVSIKMTENSQSTGNNPYISNNAYNQSNPYNLNNYNANSNYNDGRDLSYKQLGFGVHGKFYFTVGSKIRPFAGARLAYNRGSFKWEENDVFSINNSQQYGNEEKVSSNHIAGSILIGAEVELGKMFMAELSLEYERALTSGVNDEVDINRPDQTALRALAADIEGGNVASINLGLAFKF